MTAGRMDADTLGQHSSSAQRASEGLLMTYSGNRMTMRELGRALYVHSTRHPPALVPGLTC